MTMEMDFHTKRINLNEICTLERAVAGKIYKAGTCYIKLSATDEEVRQIHKPVIIDGRYAAIEPKDNINTDYLLIAVERSFPEFLRRYRTTINLQADTLKHFEVDWHNDKDTQMYIVKCYKDVQDMIDMLKNQIDNEKLVKKWYLENMMV